MEELDIVEEQDIFDNIADLTPEQIYFFIKQKKFTTFDRLKDPRNTGGDFDIAKQKKVDELIKNGEDYDWQAACEADTIEAYDNYLMTWQEGKYRSEARERKKKCLSNEEIIAWKAACEANSVEGYDNYLRSWQEGNFRDQARENKAKIGQKQEEEDWKKLNKRSKDSLQEFLKKYPNGMFAKNAEDLLFNDDVVDSLKAKIVYIYTDGSGYIDPDEAVVELIRSNIEQQIISKDDLVSLIAEDHNLLNSLVIKRLNEYDIISRRDLVGYVDNKFLRYLLDNVDNDCYDNVESSLPDSIPDEFTEVYFWGIPASGKTCALGGILSAAKEYAENIQYDIESKAYDYMTRLASTFKIETVCTLPFGTPKGMIHEMRFTLTDKKKKDHPIAFLDFAGEIFTCMHKSIAGKVLADEEQKTLEKLNELLSNRKTRKIHFFVVECGGEKKRYQNLCQDDYLASSVGYLANLIDVMKESTDGVYLLVTKWDKPTDQSVDVETYVKRNYRSLYQNLSILCEKNDINNQVINVEYFTLGEVCFQNYCCFNPDASKAIVDILMERSAAVSGTTWIDIFKL